MDKLCFICLMDMDLSFLQICNRCMQEAEDPIIDDAMVNELANIIDESPGLGDNFLNDANEIDDLADAPTGPFVDITATLPVDANNNDFNV